ncbi:MAG: N-acetyl-gamma-glutamyl-phosphate reductase [Myxococcales bacterium]|nr:N-acetyl-gamma-glutamyl-phosphate reductase [Myxococcales bacterium]
MTELSVGVVGARGYVGLELLRLLGGHPELAVSVALSRSAAGAPVGAHVAAAYRAPPFSGTGSLPDFDPALRFEDLSPAEAAAREVDAWVLALPNDHAPAWVAALTARRPVVPILDLSSDHRGDDGWIYGSPERLRARLAGARRVANPGCYATGAFLALAPLVARLAGPPSAFGVSGYSGAGTTPSARNDPARLRDNLVPYALVGHAHERELCRHLGHEVRFVPHVAPFFRGIVVTVSLELREPTSAAELEALYREAYAGEPLVTVTRDVPEPRAAVEHHHVTLGGCAVSGRHAVVVATLDNLLKGAATQAVQNLNLMLGRAELAGIAVP